MLDQTIIITWENMEQYSSVPMEYRFVDSAEVIPGKEAYGRKLVSSLDWYFKFHFPGNPVMPGVLVMETMQQTGLLIVTSLPEVEEKVMFFQGCRNMRMFNSIRPGDTLKTHVTLNDFKRGIANYHGDVWIKRPGEEKELKACSMDFMMLLKSQMLSMPVREVTPVEAEIGKCRGECINLIYSNFDAYLADPAEYRFVDSAQVWEQEAKGYKNVSSQDWYFDKSKRNEMPVGFLMEAIMQTGVLLVSQRKEITDPLMMFNGCKRLDILNVVRPGSQLRMTVKLKLFRGGIANYIGWAYVEDKKICEMEFMLIHPGELSKLSSAMSERKV